MRKGSRDYLQLGTWNCLCMRCGAKYKANELRKEWNGLIVCPTCFETRQPQDLIKGRPDNPSVPFSVPRDPQDPIGTPVVIPPYGSNLL